MRIRWLGWVGCVGCVVVFLAACGGGGHHAGSNVSSSDATRYCAFSAACGGSGGGGCATAVIEVGAIGTVGIADPRQLGRDLDCAASGSGGCAGFDACDALGHDAAYCTAHPGYSCDGDTVVLCGSLPTPSADGAEDCAAAGMHCSVISTTGPTEAACTTGVACAAGSTAPRCEGDVLVECTSYGEVRTHCAEVYANGLCAPASGGGVYCTPGGPACTTSEPTVCEGNEIVGCERGHQIRFDCSKVAGTCMDTAGDVRCAPTGTACTSDSPDRCTGTTWETCLGGVYVGTDCTALGFTTCTAGVDAAAHCS